MISELLHSPLKAREPIKYLPLGTFMVEESEEAQAKDHALRNAGDESVLPSGLAPKFMTM